MTTLNVTIDTDVLIDLFTDRLNYWKEYYPTELNDENYTFLRDYLVDIVDRFNGCCIDPKFIIDMLISNHFVTTEEEIPNPDRYNYIKENCIYRKNNKCLVKKNKVSLWYTHKKIVSFYNKLMGMKNCLYMPLLHPKCLTQKLQKPLNSLKCTLASI